ncbi:crossover junction endodeoxyribonuclease RuvC [Pseudorhodoplanes sp.]|uniref:crossover junction endodeoxyribonuclease RuvC n=1 Tax=Pseudorhodoplanes sp. TaxID=1934341 RepID=UPI003919A74A
MTSPSDFPAILALDLGSRTGWALRGATGAIASGTQEFRPGRFEGAGMAFLRFERFLADASEASGPFGVVVFEEVRAHAGTLAAQVYGGFLAHLTAWCERHAAPYLGVPVATIKRHVTGKGNASKDDVIKAVRARGHAPKDDNEADALALLDWAISNGIGA